MKYYITYNEYYTLPKTRTSKAMKFNVELGNIYRSAPDSYFQTAEGDDIQPGNPAYVVLVNYQDGDTFGQNGYWSIEGVFADYKDAERRKENCEDKDEWHPWWGFFASLNFVEIVLMPVQS